jgi:SOS response regulatory protein OraA/RecX
MGDVFDKTLSACLRLLAQRDRFESELREKFKDVPKDTLDQVIAHLRKRRFIDDDRTAEEFARTRTGKRAVSSSFLAQELEERGAPSGVVDMVRGRSDLEAALALLEARYVKSDDCRERAGRNLARRGFEMETIENALSRFFGAEAGD